MIGYQLTINAARRAEATALVFGARRLSYVELNDRACRLANGMAAMGIEPGDRVAALLHNCSQFIEALFAAAKLGAIFVPINFRLVAREVGELLEASSPKLLVAGDGFANVLDEIRDRPAFPRNVIRVDDQYPVDASSTSHPYETWLASQAADEPAMTVLSSDVQMLLHSSGTTGLPKGIIYTHATTLASSTAKIIDFGLTPADRTVIFGALFHVAPLMDLAMPLLIRGGGVVLGPSRKFDPQRLLATLSAERGTVFPIYASMLRRAVNELTDISTFDLSSVRLIITGGEPFSRRLIEDVRRMFPNAGLINNYGSTEGGPITCFLAPEDSIRKLGSVGKESFSVEVRIADEHDRPVAPGEVGEILVSSPFVCRGYWNRPEATTEAQRNGWWHTGDLAWRDDAGYLYISGRRKDMIRSGGENIYPVEVERAISTLPGVLEVGVVGVPDEEWGESVVAFVVAAAGADLDAAKVIEHSRQNLASYKKPRHVRFVDDLPRTTMGKIARSELKRQFAGA